MSLRPARPPQVCSSQKSDYVELFAAALAGRVVRRPPRPGLRVRILGPLEARLTESDRVVLGGLVEGTWPPESNTDAWLSRPMRLALGLDLPERRIGLSAHDFAQLLGAREVILSHAAKIAGAPTVPSRFIQRLAAVAGARWQAAVERGENYLVWARELDRPEQIAPAPQPAPKPPRAARPKSLSVTEIEDWLRDPYTIYAKHILRLRPLDAVDTEPGAAERGTIIHAAIGEFTKRFAKELPADPAGELIALGEPHFAALEDFPEARAFWWPRFLRIAHWFARWEAGRRGAIDPHRRRNPRRDSTSRSATAHSSFAAIADRIERDADGRYVILDYKTGAVRSEKQVRTGLAPQLTLEAAMLRNGGFTGIPTGASVSRNRLREAQGRRTGRRIRTDRVQGRYARQPGRPRAGKTQRPWHAASRTRTSPTARSSIRCGGRITATTTISRASRNGRAAAARSMTSEAANEDAGSHSADGARLQREVADPGRFGLGRRQCRIGQDPCAGAARDQSVARRRRAGENPLHHLHQGGRRQYGEARVRHARALGPRSTTPRSTTRSAAVGA